MKNLIRSTLTLAALFFTFLLIVIFIPLFTNLTESTATWFSVPIALIIGWYTWTSLTRAKLGAIAASVFIGDADRPCTWPTAREPVHANGAMDRALAGNSGSTVVRLAIF